MIKLYQKIPGSFHMQCRYIPTCSNYAIEAIETHGCIYGTFLSIRRILHCNPLIKPGYDPVPKKKERGKKWKKL